MSFQHSVRAKNPRSVPELRAQTQTCPDRSAQLARRCDDLAREISEGRVEIERLHGLIDEALVAIPRTRENVALRMRLRARGA